MRCTSPRALGALGAALCLAALLIAYFILQQHLGLLPCPLCIIDRFLIAALGCGFLCVAISQRTAIRTAALSSNCILMLLAFATGGRHLWLEANPPPLDETGGCAPGGSESQALLEWMTSAFIGTSDCATVPWKLLGLSVAGWTMAFFVALALLLLATIASCRREAKARHVIP